MAEFDHTVIRFTDPAGGECRIVAVCEDTQTEQIPDSPYRSPLVVAVRLVNTTTTSRGVGRWLHSNGQEVTGVILPGENQQINVSPPRRVYLYRLTIGLARGPL
jgi:hypothetical protein